MVKLTYSELKIMEEITNYIDFLGEDEKEITGKEVLEFIKDKWLDDWIKNSSPFVDYFFFILDDMKTWESPDVWSVEDFFNDAFDYFRYHTSKQLFINAMCKKRKLYKKENMVIFYNKKCNEVSVGYFDGELYHNIGLKYNFGATEEEIKELAHYFSAKVHFIE